MIPGLFVAPRGGAPQTRHNWIAAQKEALSFGPMDAAGSFLPVLVTRLGGTSIQVGLITAIPALAGFVLAIPLGHFLQGRRNVVPWYSRGRFINQLVLFAIGVTLVVLPSAAAIPPILVLVGLSAIVGSFANFSFYAVMDGLSGPNGRYELMGRRWGMKGAATAVSLAIIGWILAEMAFPHAYTVVYIATIVPALFGFRYSRTFRIPDQPAAAHHREPGESRHVLARARAFIRELGHDRRFLGFLGRHTVLSFGLNMALPLIPLYYVRQLGASDAWIGLIGTTQALLTMTGYFLWRRTARRRGGSRWVVYVSTIGVGLFPAVLAVTTSELLVPVLVGFYGICLAGIELGIFDELMKAVPPDQALRFASLDQGATNFAGMTGPLLGATLAGIVGIPGGLTAAAFVTLTGAGLFVASVRRRHARPDAAAGGAGAPLDAAEPGEAAA